MYANIPFGGEPVLLICEELRIGLFPFSLLGRGYFTGKVDEHTTHDSNHIRSHNSRFTTEAIQANRAVVDLLEQIAQQKGDTAPQIALAWLLVQKPWIVPIPVLGKLERLDENIGADEIHLTHADPLQIEKEMVEIKEVGDRY